MTRITVVGDTLLDRDLDGRVERICPEAPVPVLDAVAERARPGGAGLAAALGAADGHEVTLVTALSLDDSGRHLASLLEAADVEVVDIGLASPTPVKVRLRCEDRLLLRVDHAGVTGKPGEATPAASEAIRAADAVLVSDYGRGVTADLTIRRELARSNLLVWDPHPRGPEPVEGCTLVTPNQRETG